jgi:hypothetical protein
MVFSPLFNAPAWRKVLGRQVQTAISVEPQRSTGGDLLRDQPFGVTRLMEGSPFETAVHSCPGTIGLRHRQQLSRQSTSRSRIHLSMSACSRRVRSA